MEPSAGCASGFRNYRGGILLRIAVRYQSRGGNTKKVAEAVARKAGVVAKPLDPQEKLSGVDLLFVGGGVYAGRLHKTVTEALSALTGEQAGCVAFFYTAMDPEAKVVDKAKAAVKDSSVEVMDNAFHCKGKFLLFSREHPNAADLANAESFAKRAVDARRKALEAKK